MTEYLVISALGADRPGIVNEFSEAVLAAGCNIAESRMAVLGGEFALMLMVVGESQAIANLNQRRTDLEERLGLTILTKLTTLRPAGAQAAPYIVKVVAMDHPGIVHEVADFFSQHKINIEEMSTETYPAAHTGTPMFSLNMIVSIASDIKVGQLREAFVDFCDNLNLDASLEPASH